MVDANAVLALTVPFQCFQPFPGRRAQKLQCRRRLELRELTSRHFPFRPVARAIALKPPLDVGLEPAATAARALLGESSRAYPAVNSASVATGDSLDIMGCAQYLIHSSDPLR